LSGASKRPGDFVTVSQAKDRWFLAGFSFFLCFFMIPRFSRAETEFTITAAGSRIIATVEEAPWQVTASELQQWVQRAADAVVAYYGRYPVPRLTLRIRSFAGRGVGGGRTFSREGGLIRIAVGLASSHDDLASDWMLTHEMVHLTFPDMSEEHHWIEEGIATYVEPIARIQTGQFNAPRMWFELVRDMPKGLPQPGDGGLDHTHTWGRTYWGGALFCFLADVEIRKQTQNKKGLQDALREILKAGGDMREHWDLEKALAVGDRSVGGKVLQQLFAEMRDQPVAVDLESLWKQLGIRIAGESAEFDDSAPFAQIRKAITSPLAQEKNRAADAPD
jgi:hypothetical protein